MSLLRLLTAGKSLVGLKKSETRYHLPGNRALPKFGSKKNPFRATALPEQSEPVREPESGAKGIPSGSANEERAQDPPEALAGAEEKQSATGVTGAANNDSDRDCRGPGKPLERDERRSSPVKALLLWGRAKKAKRAGAVSGRPLVQAELSLDSVKVVRNDLSESDLEIIRGPGRSSVPQRAEKDNPAETKASAPDLGWGAAAGRLLGIGKM